ncbi:MAG: RagB/SusD family nutrient uptake outer membrane protein [Candidatus Pedobacter colombiensis]|uniref:RagB/SusD family nutrient uptake outer membrane protein n=1 Tax=Candidatus Pedobacter colombiensis TaxID=3121371 RepID=A0AAJ5W7F1_9SPHI|nr:RagB/SusD family nutrient uptake outer membrane protein [Pedobacter sp.]WEK18980.1 MAG: RagB/SusD family nutrient uptake outer membrane protein [Pedobacter sp.]
MKKMKLITNRYIMMGLAAVLLLTASCKKVLDITPVDQVTDPLMWTNQDMVLTYTGNFYAQMNAGFSGPHPNSSIFTGNLLSDITDDGEVNSTIYNTYWNGAYDSSNSPLNGMWTATSFGRWMYIRRANMFLSKIDAVPGDPNLNKRMKAEIRFLRAFYYFEFMNWFGPVPIITTAQNDLDESAFVAKPTKDEFNDFLVNELTAAAADLPVTYATGDWGRITKGAALAMKGRIQLYAGRWADAATTNKAVIDLKTYALQASYSSVFANNNKMNNEVILTIQFNGDKAQRSHLFDTYNQPPAFGGRGGTLPTQNLVDEYEMQATGLPITDVLSGYDKTQPYVGRDPRFAATVLYDGSVFRGRSLQLYNGGVDLTVSGGIIAGWVTNTGYYLRKFTDESINLADANIASGQNWILFRYAEVLLNYAEAQNEAFGADATVYDAVNKVRKRAGMPDLPTGLSQTDMRTAIRHERRVELAFEDARYWDVKRWKLAVNLFSTATNPIKKMEIVRDPVTGVKTYTVKNLTKLRVFQEKHYLFPFPITEINKPGNKIEQNTGW